MRKKKDIHIEYSYIQNKSEESLNDIFEKLLMKLLNDRKELKRWRRSEEYKKLCQQLIEEKSMLADFILPS